MTQPLPKMISWIWGQRKWYNMNSSKSLSILPWNKPVCLSRWKMGALILGCCVSLIFVGLGAIKMKSCLNIIDGLSSISKSFHNFKFLFKSNNFYLHGEIYVWTDFWGETKFGFISIIAQKIPINFCMKMRNITLCKPACIFYLCEGNKYPAHKCIVS